MRLICLFTLALLVGCSATRSVTISTEPPDANLLIDGRQRGRGPITETFTFTGSGEAHRILASREGYNDRETQIGPNFAKENLVIRLRPQTKLVTINISPVPANVTVDGQAVGAGPVSQLRKELPFAVAPGGGRATHTVRAAVTGYETAELMIGWNDPNTEYVLELRPTTRTLTIKTEPPGADISINDLPYGQSPITYPDQGQPGPRTIRAAKPGYQPASLTISADDKRQEFTLTLGTLSKMVRLTTLPPGGTITLEGAKLIRQADGAYAARLEFKPSNDRGEMPIYAGEAGPPAGADAEWERQKFAVAWDEGKNEYAIELAKITSRDMPWLELEPTRTADGWRITPQPRLAKAMLSTQEDRPNKSLDQVTHLAAGTALESFALSADGAQLLLVTLVDEGRHTILWLAPADGSAPPRQISDGRNLDMNPAFTPDGQQIVFASDRGGKGLSLWTAAADGGDMKALPNTGGGLALSPTIDASPRPRLFYEMLADNQEQPTLYVQPLTGGAASDLKTPNAQQPRIGPKADAIVFARPTPQGGKRDLFRIADQGGQPINLTRTPNSDERDAAWSWDGRRIVFASDRTADPANYDIWLLDLATARPPVQITSNASHDDQPVWDVMGRAVFFRSNRGGAWQIWKITLP